MTTSTNYDQLVDLILCTMGYSDFTGGAYYAWNFCSTFSGADYDAIMECLAGKDGETAFIQMQNKTLANSDYEGTPWVNFNGVRSFSKSR